MIIRKAFRATVGMTLGITMILGLVGCGGKKTKEEGGGVPTSAMADENLAGDSDSGKAMGLQTVHFPFDASTLDEQAKEVLHANATVLKEKPNLKVQIEGHCDQRGGIQYNIALGERRANAARKFLEDLGISGDRMTVISFGKEKPIDNGTTEDAYAKNRRDNFVITSH